MENKYVIFIEDELDNFAPLFEKVNRGAPFKTKLICYEDFETDYIKNLLKNLKSVDLILAVDSEFYKKTATQLTKNINTVFANHFTNFIYICRDYDKLFLPETLSAEKSCLYFSMQCDQQLLAAHYILFLVNLFDKAVIQERLNDYICNSFREVVYSELLAKKNKKLKQQNELLEKQNGIDHQTNLYNKTALSGLLAREQQRTARTKWRLDHLYYYTSHKPHPQKPDSYAHKPQGNIRDCVGVFALLLISLNGWEEVNDKFGCLKGDEILFQLVQILNHSGILRACDIPGRYSSRQFYVILPETDSNTAIIPAKRLIDAFRVKAFTGSDGTPGTATLAIGIAGFAETDRSPEEIIKRAEAACIQASRQPGHGIARYEAKT